MIFYAIAVPALLLIAFIMLCRANDMLRKAGSLHSYVRLFGLILVGFSPWGIIGWDFYINGVMPSPFFCLMVVGLTFVFITTPQGIPFWKWFWEGTEVT